MTDVSRSMLSEALRQSPALTIALLIYLELMHLRGAVESYRVELPQAVATACR